MKIINVIQNSPDWHKFRETHIGASEVAAIMGVSPWETELQLFQRKLGLLPPKEMNHFMQRGHTLEPKAREYFELKMNKKYNPCVGEDDERPFLCASFDGFNFESGTAVEIKCPGMNDHTSACFGCIPEKYK